MDIEKDMLGEELRLWDIIVSKKNTKDKGLKVVEITKDFIKVKNLKNGKKLDMYADKLYRNIKCGNYRVIKREDRYELD